MLTDAEIKDIQTWREADKDYEVIWRKMKERMADEIRTITGPGKASWWEKDAVDLTRRRPRDQFDVRYPRQRRDGRDRRKAGRREGLKLPRKLKAEDTNRPEQLVPIRLEFDVEHHRMRDSFVWNLNGTYPNNAVDALRSLIWCIDPVVTPEAFAQSVVEDYGLAPSYHAVITKSIQDQLSDFRIHSTNPDGDFNEADADLVQGELDEEDAAWWESWRKRLRTTRGFIKSARRAGGKDRKRKLALNGEAVVGSETPAAELNTAVPMDVDDIEVDESKMHEDMRILIKLDIVVGSMKLEDQFEWDLDNVDASPEHFAEVYGADLGLTGEYKTAIAHCIREQVQMYQKSLFLVGHPSSDGSAIHDEDLRLSFLPSLSSGARAMDQVGSFTPLLNYLSDGDIEREEKEREKELNKRRKRNTRGRRGVALPDREPIRTHRTPAIGFPELDPSTLAAAVAASAPTSRRAAAAAASLTIANMVASENGTLHMPQTTPLTSQPAPSASKEKKPKGHFKAPSYPSSVLRPRARVTAPTPSTAAESSSLSIHVDHDAPSRSSAPDSKASKVITAKRAKELEREAKEKEYADGQHANMIDGVWHCSNCGCPEDIAVGRRKGPLGDKSQCGTCGKYWHRHRRPMAVEYNSSSEYHLNKIKEAELARRKGGAAALHAQNASTAAAGDDTETGSSPPNENNAEPLPRPAQPPAVPASGADTATSPGSSTSSDSESPLAQKVSKVNGSNHATSAPPAPPALSGPATTQPSQPVSQSVPPSTTASAPPAAAASPDPPKWLWNATQAMRTKYPDDIFVL
jgi:SWI/SNF-related matrix-associated actin-dependent regulator of chromatin subfamily B protein 1